MTDEHKKLNEILEHFDTAMLVTTSVDEMIRARPMHIADLGDEGEMWFLTSRDSTQAADVNEDIRAAITLQDHGRQGHQVPAQDGQGHLERRAPHGRLGRASCSSHAVT